MKYKTSFFNKAIIAEDLKRLWGISLLYSLIMFFSIPLQIMFLLGDYNSNNDYIMTRIQRILHTSGMEMQIIFSLVFCIVLAMLVFRYLHQSKSTTVMHSFPITRKQLFHSHSIAGFLLILAPVVFNSLILIVTMLIHNDGSILFNEVYTIGNIGIWTGITLLVNISIYLISTFIAMITGTTLIQGVLSLIVIFLPVGLGQLILLNIDQLLYGFTTQNNLFKTVMGNLIPVTGVLINDELGLGLIAWYILLGVILYTIAYYSYQNRELERASDPIAFDILKPVFKYGVTFSAMVLGGAYFYSLKRIDLWLYIGYIIGGYLGYIIAEMIIQKTIWVFRNVKGLITYGIVIVILFVGINLDIFGFEKRVPGIDNVENAYYGYGLYGYLEGQQQGLKEVENIELIRSFHKEIINNKNKFVNTPTDARKRYVGIAYKLKNGKTLLREYLVPYDFIENSPYVKGIYESREYKINNNRIFSIDNTKIEYVQIEPRMPVGRDVKIVDDGEISELIEIVKEEILNETYEEYKSNIIPWATIRFRYEENSQQIGKDNLIYIQWKKTYDNLSDWMKQKGYYEKARAMPDDIDYVTVEKIDENMDVEEFYKRIETEKLSENMDKVKIEDKKEIEYLLTNFTNYYHEVKGYIVKFYFNNGNSFTGVIEEKNAPKYISEYFK